MSSVGGMVTTLLPVGWASSVSAPSSSSSGSASPSSPSRAAIEELLQAKQKEYVDADGMVDDVSSGFKAVLRELLLGCCMLPQPSSATHATAASPASPSTPNPTTPSGPAIRNFIVDILKSTLDVPSDAQQPSVAQVALVDVIWLIWSEFEHETNKDDATASPAAPPTTSTLTQSKDRFVACINGILAAKRNAAVDGATIGNDPMSITTSTPMPLLPIRTVKETLQADLLDALGVFHGPALTKAVIGARTGAWYRQQKFNLLHEETEGWSKLFTELNTFFQLPRSSTSAPLLLQRVSSFIGFFDLDPNRVVDVMLDCFARHHQYAPTGQLTHFLALIDTFQKDNMAQIMGAKFRNYYEQYKPNANNNNNTQKNEIGPAPTSLFDLAAILVKTGRVKLEALYSHLSPSDASMALARTDLLAEEEKKLKRMNVVSLSSKSSGDDDGNKRNDRVQPPQQLSQGPASGRIDQGIVVSSGDIQKEEISAVLIGTPIQAMQLDTTEPAPTQPADAAPPPTSKSSIRATASSASAKNEASAAASTSTATAAAAAAVPVAAASPPLPAPPNQKFQLLASLLNQNAYSYAEILLTHLEPVNPASHPAVGRALIAFINRMIRPLLMPITNAQRAFANNVKPANYGKNAPDAALPSAVLDSSHSVAALPSDEPFQWTTLSDADVEERITEQHTKVLSLETYHASLPTIMRVLKHLNVYLCNDVVTWTRLCRIMAHIVTNYMKDRRAKSQPASTGNVGAIQASATTTDDDDELLSQIEDMIGDVLLPAFSLMAPSHSSSHELWLVLKQLPYEMRYRLYGYWQTTIYTSKPELMALKASVLHRAKYFRKRIAAATVKECSRLILKFAENNPILVFQLLLQQIQSFDNMINPVTDCLKLLHPLAFDSLAFVLLDQLSGNKVKLSEDGVNETHWFQSLSTFAGTLFRKYPETDLAPLLYFILHQLTRDEPHDLLLLKEIIVQMSNVEIHEDVSEREMEGRAGGRVLQAETTTVRDKNNKNKTRSTKALMDAILKNRLALPLFIAIAQQQSYIEYLYASEHVKLVSELYDKCHEALLQWVAILDHALQHSDAQYAGQLCSIHKLVMQYHAKPRDAFHALRRVIHTNELQASQDEAQAGKSEDHMEMDGVAEQEHKSNDEMKDDTQVKKEPELKPSPYSALIRSTRTFLPDSVWLSLTPSFYTLFWRLSLAHLHVPTATYESQIAKLKSTLPALDSSLTPTGLQKTDSEKRACKIERDRVVKILKALPEEQKQQEKQVAAVYEELERDKDSWFDGVTHPTSSMLSFLQFCVLPRVLHSGIDAHYTAQFILTIVKLNTKGFNYLDLFDQLFKCVGPLLSSCSLNEASRFGRFFSVLLSDFHRFAYDEAAYTTLCSASPACFVPLPKAGAQTANPNAPPPPATIPFSDVSILVQRCHLRLAKMFARTLSATAGASKMEINAALLLLCKIGTEYPRTYSQGMKVEALLDAIIANEENKNSALKVLGLRSHALLQEQKKTWIRDVQPPAPKHAADGKANSKEGKTGAGKPPSRSPPATAAGDGKAAGKPPTGREPSSAPPSRSDRKRGRSREPRASPPAPSPSPSLPASTQPQPSSDRSSPKPPPPKKLQSKLNLNAREFTPSPAKPTHTKSTTETNDAAASKSTKKGDEKKDKTHANGKKHEEKKDEGRNAKEKRDDRRGGGREDNRDEKREERRDESRDKKRDDKREISRDQSSSSSSSRRSSHSRSRDRSESASTITQPPAHQRQESSGSNGSRRDDRGGKPTRDDNRARDKDAGRNEASRNDRDRSGGSRSDKDKGRTSPAPSSKGDSSPIVQYKHRDLPLSASPTDRAPSASSKDTNRDRERDRDRMHMPAPPVPNREERGRDRQGQAQGQGKSQSQNQSQGQGHGGKSRDRAGRESPQTPNQSPTATTPPAAETATATSDKARDNGKERAGRDDRGGGKRKRDEREEQSTGRDKEDQAQPSSSHQRQRDRSPQHKRSRQEQSSQPQHQHQQQQQQHHHGGMPHGHWRGGGGGGGRRRR